MDSLTQAAESQALSVAQLTKRISHTLEAEFSELWVRGEVSNLRRQASGHLYFTIKDAESQLACVLFRADANRQTCAIDNGMEVLLYGGLSVYPPRGSYQFIARLVLESGVGRLQAEFDRLKRQLASEGLFAKERKQPLPVLPKRIAVITSPTGAAIQDFIRILKRRAFSGSVLVLPAKVQGAGAAAEIRRQLEVAKRIRPDVVVLTRGGGSIEDLWAFNDVDLVRAVADFPFPIVSAIGHEIDFVLTDFAADVRAETPSGAAELLSSLQVSARERLVQLSSELELRNRHYLKSVESRLKSLQIELRTLHPKRIIENYVIQIDDLETRFHTEIVFYLNAQKERVQKRERSLDRASPIHRLHLAQQRLEHLRATFKRITENELKAARKSITTLAQRHASSSVEASLKRGFALLLDDNDRPIPDLKSLEATQTKMIKIRLRDGETTLTKPS